MKRSLLMALPILAACSGPLLTAPPGEWATLPRDAVTGAGDPTRTAVITTNAVFGDRTPAELPATRNATTMMESELHRIDTERFSGGGPSGSGGGGGAQP